MNGLLLTYALTYGGAVIALFRPYSGLLIYIAFAILKPPALWPWAVPPGSYSRVIATAFLVGWVLSGFGDQRLGRAKSVILAVLGYYLWIILSTAFSPFPERGTPFIEYFGKTIIPVLAGMTLIHTRRQINQLMLVLIGCAAFLAYECNLAYLGGISIERYGFLATDNNTFSIFVVTGYGLALVRGFEDPNSRRRWLYLAIAAGMAHVPMLAFSRGGMLGIAAASVVVTILTPKNRRVWWTLAAACLVGATLAGPSVVAEFASSFEEEGQRDFSAESRILLWRDCTDVALKYPLFGIGQGAWPAVAHEYGWPEGKAAHSVWFQALAEVGFPGLGFLLLFYFLVLRNAWLLTRSSDQEMQILGRMVIASIAGFGVCGSFLSAEGLEFPFYVALLGACATKLNQSVTAEEWSEDDGLVESHDRYVGHQWITSHT